MLEILLWFMYGCLLGLLILIYIAIIGLVMYGVFSIAFALFDVLGIENPFLVIWEFIKGGIK